MPEARKHVVRRVVKAVCATPWAIHEPTLEAMVELLDLRRDGMEFTPDEVQARIGLPQQSDQPPMTIVGDVAVIPIHGVMAPRMNLMMQVSGGTSTQKAGDALRKAVADSSIKAIVLDIDSPGGAVSGTQELAELVTWAATYKPVKAVAQGMAASAAYWIATAADELIVNPSALVGSIGVYSVYTDTSRADQNAGIDHTVIRSAPNKATPSGYEPLGEKGRETMKETVDDAHQAFVGAVAQGRGVSPEHVEANFGGGKTFYGSKAVRLGMADRIGTLERVVAELNGSATARPTTRNGVMKMSANLKAMLVKRGLVAADADDEAVAKAAEKALGDTSQDEQIVTGTLPGHSTKEVGGNSAISLFNSMASRLEQPSHAADPADILAAVQMASLPDDFDRVTFAQSLLQARVNGRPLGMGDVVRKLQDETAKHNKPVGASVDQVRLKVDSIDKFRGAARDAMLIRANGGWNQELSTIRDTILSEKGEDGLGAKPAEGAITDRRLQSVMGLAERCLLAEGYSQQTLNRLTQTQVAQLALGVSTLSNFGIYASSDGPAYNTTGLFSSVMMDVSNNAMRRGYAADRATYDRWMKRGESLPDFRSKYLTLLGEMADPQAIPENGEFPETTIQDEHESYKLTVWGSMFSISWQAMVNDNIGAFTTIPEKQGRSMRRKQNRLAYNVVKDNAALQDTGLLFNATAQSTAGGHANLTTGAGAPSVTTLNALELKMLNMIGPTGADNADAQALNIVPQFIIVPPALFATVEELLGSMSYVAANVNSGVRNRWEQRLQIVVDAELGSGFGGSDTAWYLAADPRDIDTIEYAFMQGLETPQLDQEQGFTSLGRKYRIYQPFAAKAIDYRGMQKHAGA